MSNLTCASGDASGSIYNQQYFSPPIISQTTQPAAAAAVKKKRNLPGNPDPDAEVVALSPQSLLATNRFLCDVCNKGFKRDQNLQLHRRGHNLPWKLKQRTSKDVMRKKVYVCPEATCVHHDPSRALGDLTGIKKHFCRKHGEKKWKCDKCSKRYAVQSDWKAHSKTCGTREYRCDCGTLFSRRDSFITHRAFCDALAADQESTARAISGINNPFLFPPRPPPQVSNSSSSHIMNLQNIQPQIFINMNNHHNPHDQYGFPLKKEQQNFDTNNIPLWLDLDHNQDFQNAGNPNVGVGPTTTHHQQDYHHHHHQHHQPIASPHLSATALLQRAAQMGAKMSSSTRTCSSPPMMGDGAHQGGHVYADSGSQIISSTTAGRFGLDLYSRENFPREAGMAGSTVFGNKAAAVSHSGLVREHGSPAAAGGAGAGAPSSATGFDGYGNLTRDFLGLRPLSHGEIFLNMAGFSDHDIRTSLNQDQNQPQQSWQGD